MAAAIRGGGDDKTADACAKSGKKWRFGYARYFEKMVRLSCEAPETAIKVARAGVDAMHSSFEFIDSEGVTSPFSEYMAKVSAQKSPFETGTITGTGKRGVTEYRVPYLNGEVLAGESLNNKLDEWAEYGTIEDDCRDAIKSVVNNPKWMDLTGKTFVLIGAGSAMGPLPKLLELGATVVALDIPGCWGKGTKRASSGVWKRIIEMARNSPGKLVFPLSKPQADCKSDTDLFESAGADLMCQPAEILAWLRGNDVVGAGKFTIGNYTYLDGELHVKLSICADAIMDGLVESQGPTNVALAYLCTPTDLHVIPEKAWLAAKTNSSFFGNPLGWPIEKLINILSRGAALVPNVVKPASGLYLVDGLSVAQGPNYALAKRLQHWRAMLAYDRGATVSSNIAPSTSTASVVSNKTFAWAYGGMPYFKPYEILVQDTTNAVMAGMLIHDITNDKCWAHPANRNNPKHPVKNTLELFKFGSFNGGVWRAGYKLDKLGSTSVLIHFLGGCILF